MLPGHHDPVATAVKAFLTALALGALAVLAVAAFAADPPVAVLQWGYSRAPWCTVTILDDYHGLGAFHCTEAGTWFHVRMPSGKNLGEVTIVRIRGDLMLVRFEKPSGVTATVGRRPRGMETKVEVHCMAGGEHTVNKMSWTKADTLDWTGEEVFMLEGEGGAVQGGCSGGAVMFQGQVIGVAVAKNLAGDRGWAIAIEDIPRLWEEDLQ